jgi:hypothetical protein
LLREIQIILNNRGSVSFVGELQIGTLVGGLQLNVDNVAPLLQDSAYVGLKA